MNKLQQELEEIEKELDAQRVKCLACRDAQKKLDDEYMEIEIRWLKVSRELEK